MRELEEWGSLAVGFELYPQVGWVGFRQVKESEPLFRWEGQPD